MTSIDLRDGPSGPYAGLASIVRANLADLVARDSAVLPNGCRAWVQSEGVEYQLDTANPFAVHPTLVIARPTLSTVQTGPSPVTQLPGRWYRRSRSSVVANNMFWCTGSQSGVTHKVVFGLSPGQLLASATVVPDVVLDLSATLIANAGGTLQGFLSEACTDSQGNVWVAMYNTTFAAPGHSFKLKLADCLRSGSPTPAVDLAGISAATDRGNSVVCFDKQNNLWNGGSSSFRQIGQYQAQLSGAPTPLVTLQGATAWATVNRYMVFDAVGNMWFTNSFGGVAQISKVTPAQYAVTNAALVPSVLWTGTNILNVQDLAFDSNGLLWSVEYVTGLGNGLIKAFDPTQASGNPAPVFTLSSPRLSGGVGLAFDSGGNLWIGNNDNGALLKFQASDLTSSGAKTPVVEISQTTLTNLGSCRFSLDPQRVGLALSGVPTT